MTTTIPARECTLSDDSRDRFAAGQATHAERAAILRHLLAACPLCVPALRPRVALAEPNEPQEMEVISMPRLLTNLAEFERRLKRERSDAAALWNDFKNHPAPRQWTLLRNSSRFGLFAFAEILLHEGFEAIYDDPKKTLDLSEMGLFVALALEPSYHGARSLHDLRGRSWARVANARRAHSDLLGAEQAIAAAGKELLEGTGEPLIEAEFHYFSASIHRAQRRFDEARRSLRRSKRIYRAVGDHHLEGRSLLNEALVHELDGDLSGAIERIHRALPMIDESRDRHLALGARHNLLWCLTAAGRGEEAAIELRELRPRYDEVGDRMSLILLRWMEGRIAVQQGRPELAEIALREAHEAFLEREIPYEAATVAFDLASLFADQGRTTELKTLAAELVTVFHRLGVRREAIAALMLFERSAQAEAVTAALVAKLARYFENARRMPAAEFLADESAG